jgi:hypothetical protein
VPGAAVVTAIPPEVTAKFVVVADAAQAGCTPPQRAIHKIAELKNSLSILAFMGKLHSSSHWLAQFMNVKENY